MKAFFRTLSCHQLIIEWKASEREESRDKPDEDPLDEDNDQSHDEENEGEVGDEAVDGRGRADLLHPGQVELRVCLTLALA